MNLDVRNAILFVCFIKMKLYQKETNIHLLSVNVSFF